VLAGIEQSVIAVIFLPWSAVEDLLIAAYCVHPVLSANVIYISARVQSGALR
jgi:hypothetical protein